MKDLDVNSYIATFKQLTLAAGWDIDAQGTIERFTKGLQENIHRRVINRDNEPITWDKWKEAMQAEVHKVRKTISAGLDFGNWNRNKPCDTGPFQTRQTQCTQLCPVMNNNNRIVPMEVDAINTQNREPFKKLTNDECKQLQKEGKCFRCHQTGHMARECPGRPQLTTCTPTNVSMRTTETTNSATAVEVTPDDSVSNAPVIHTMTTKVKLTCAQQIAALEEEMSDEERGTYLDSHDMESDFYNVEL